VQLGGVFAPADDADELLAAFMAFAEAQGRRVSAVQLRAADAERYARAGFRVNQLGASYARSLAGFTVAGGAHVRLRNKLSRARRAGVRVHEVPIAEQTPELDAHLAAIDATWLRSKGRHAKELTFMVGERGGRGAPWRRLFVATDPFGGVLGYVSFSPVPGSNRGWLHDLSRRQPEAPPGTMESIIVTAVATFRAEGATHLHFGFTPFTGLDPAVESPTPSRMAGAIVRFLAAHGARVYPAADQVAYKLKWAPDLVEPEYVAFAGGVTLGAVWQLLRLTNAA
jgi:lysylphosphatidylglycerol synthetase-like protein (DUF2156 family)